MNGRVMDPAVGRFLSVDPVYQAPTNSQSVNPYSYVMNNPLSLVDPSGYAADAACSTGSPGSTPSCDPSNISVKDLKAGQSVTATVTTTTSSTGSHIDSHATVTGTVTKNADGSVTVQTGSPNGSTGGSTGTNAPSMTNAGGASVGAPNQRQNGLSVDWSDGNSNDHHAVNLGGTPNGGATVWQQGWKDVVQIDADYHPAGGPESIATIAGRINAETLGMKASIHQNEPLSAAEDKMAHMRINGSKVSAFGQDVQHLASMMDPVMSGAGYVQAYDATIQATIEDLLGKDPTHGAFFYNMRNPGQDADSYLFQGQPPRTSSGPYMISNSSDVNNKYRYIETYGPGPWGHP